MYLSLLKLNNRSRRAMTEASRYYELHRTLLKVFPDEVDGGPGRVLFRLETNRETGAISVLVQSEKEPSWSKLNDTTGFVTGSQYKEFHPVFISGKSLRFRLRANPTKRSKSTRKREGILKVEEQIEWLRSKGQQGGFEVEDAIATSEGFSRDKMTRNAEPHDMTILSVLFEGILRVTDVEKFKSTIIGGIGPAKGFGFGLLSIAPVRG